MNSAFSLAKWKLPFSMEATWKSWHLWIARKIQPRSHQNRKAISKKNTKTNERRLVPNKKYQALFQCHNSDFLLCPRQSCIPSAASSFVRLEAVPPVGFLVRRSGFGWCEWIHPPSWNGGPPQMKNIEKHNCFCWTERINKEIEQCSKLVLFHFTCFFGIDGKLMIIISRL